MKRVRDIFPLTVMAALLVAAGACGGSEASLPQASPPAAAGTPVAPTEAPQVPTASPTASPTEPPTEPTVTPSPLSTPREPRFVSLADLTADVPLPELPEAFAAAAPDEALEALIEETLADREGSYSVVVHNLEDGRYAALNEGQVYYAASLFKLGLLLEAYRQRDAGELDFEQRLILDEEYLQYDFGTLELLGLQEGDAVTLADAIKAMIVVSDTPTAVMVQDVLGPARVDATLRSLGIEETSFNDRELPATALDMARLLEAIAAGVGVSEESRREMLSLLLQEWIREGIPAALPAEAAVAHKSGNWSEATHDVALVWGPSGPYIIVVMSDRSWEWEPIVDVSGAVWDHFAANP